jgi:hypothetical protein
MRLFVPATGDLRAVLFGSAVASAVAISIVYAPVMFALRRRIPSTAAWWSFPVVSVCLGIVPVILIVALFGGNLRSMSSPEAVLFYCMFATFGLVFGVGFFLAYRRPVQTADERRDQGKRIGRDREAARG